MSARGVLVVGTALLGSVAPALADEDLPDPEFLEYLGFWEESDEEWLIFDPAAGEQDRMRNDPAPQGEESVENDDED